MSRALVETGNEVVVVTGRAEGLPPEEKTEAGHIYRVYDRKSAGEAWIIDRVLAETRNHDVDVIEGVDHLGECAGLISRYSRVPVMIKVHACQIVKVLQVAHIYYPWQRITWGLARFRARAQLKREQFVIENADLETVCSERLLREMHKQGLSLPSATVVLPNPIVLPAKINCAGDAPVILFVGRLEFLKGIQCLPEMLRRVMQRIPDVQLRIAGGDTYARGIGSLRNWLIRRSADLQQNVVFLGQLDADRLAQEICTASVVVAPSLWDNFPGAVLEAMAYATPVVTTPHGGMPEMLKGTGAPIHDQNDPAFAAAVVDLLADPIMARKIGAACRKRCVDYYSPEAVVPRYIEFLEQNL